MPISVTFWQLPEEEENFIEFLEKDERVVAFPAESRKPVSELSLEVPSRLTRGDEPLILLALKPHVSQIKSVEYTQDGSKLFGIDATNSPVIMYERGAFREPGKLGQSVIAAHLEALTEDGKGLRRKPDEFCKWAQSVAKWVRRNTPQWHQYKSYRITGKVADAMTEGIELVP